MTNLRPDEYRDRELIRRRMPRWFFLLAPLCPLIVLAAIPAIVVGAVLLAFTEMVWNALTTRRDGTSEGPVGPAPEPRSA